MPGAYAQETCQVEAQLVSLDVLPAQIAHFSTSNGEELKICLLSCQTVLWSRDFSLENKYSVSLLSLSLLK